MSIDDKIEHLYRENKLTEKKGNKPSQRELSYEGFAVGSGEYIPANATQTEPMVFCPKCNGMMLPYLDGYKCNDCSYTKGVSEELIKESEKNDVEYVRNPEIKVKSRSRIIKHKEESISAFSRQELKEILTNLDEDIFDKVILLFGVPKSLEKEEKIDFMLENNKFDRIEANIKYAKVMKP